MSNTPRGPYVQVTPPNYGYGYGMSLRDWFAGQALAGLCDNRIVASDGLCVTPARELAIAAYETADAMLAQRQKADDDIGYYAFCPTCHAWVAQHAAGSPGMRNIWRMCWEPIRMAARYMTRSARKTRRQFVPAGRGILHGWKRAQQERDKGDQQ